MNRNLLAIITTILLIWGCSRIQEKSQNNSCESVKSVSPSEEWLARSTPVLDDAAGTLNPYVLKIIDSFPVDGSYPYRWEKNEYDIYNGVSQDLIYKGKILAKAHPNRSRCSNCCGLTFEIFFKAMQLRNKQKGFDPNDFNGMTYNDLYNAMLIWFVVERGDNPMRAIEYYGFGERITDWEEAKPGDFCDISRSNGPGHSIIFINWTRDDKGNITGIHYFSSGKKGVGFATEFFSDSGGKVLRKHVHLGRVGSIQEYKKFDRLDIPDRMMYAP